MDSRTSVHVIKTACHVVVAVFVCPAALCADHYLRCLILTSEPREQGRVRVLCGSTHVPPPVERDDNHPALVLEPGVATCQLLMKACHHQGKCVDCLCPFLHLRQCHHKQAFAC
ncbi:hypothetical protein Pelo_18567 [Pelomyxa schiedti]|nr:hypothetical protein Pelo_18567 [Pelomyxa schiedti]